MKNLLNVVKLIFEQVQTENIVEAPVSAEEIELKDEILGTLKYDN